MYKLSFLLFFAINILSANHVYASNHHPSSIPDEPDGFVWENLSSMQYAFSDDIKHVFHGKKILNGMLVVEKDGKEIALTFFPNAQSMDRLPYTQEYGKPDSIHLNELPLDKPEIFINGQYKPISGKHRPLINNNNLLKNSLLDIPSSFWQSKQARIVRSASIEIKEFATMIECDQDYHYATTTKIKPFSGTHNIPQKEGGC